MAFKIGHIVTQFLTVALRLWTFLALVNEMAVSENPWKPSNQGHSGIANAIRARHIVMFEICKISHTDTLPIDRTGLTPYGVYFCTMNHYFCRMGTQPFYGSYSIPSCSTSSGLSFIRLDLPSFSSSSNQ